MATRAACAAPRGFRPGRAERRDAARRAGRRRRPREAALSLLRRALGGLLGFRLVGEVGAVGAFVGLDVLELAALVANGLELLAGGAAVGGSGHAWISCPGSRGARPLAVPPITAGCAGVSRKSATLSSCAATRAAAVRRNRCPRSRRGSGGGRHHRARGAAARAITCSDSSARRRPPA